MAVQTKKAKSSGVGQGGFRQAQSWLHTWCGLWFSWLLFAVFLTGTLAVFEEPITHWMMPEHHAEGAAAGTTPPASADRAQRLAWGLAYMEKHHPGTEMWELWPADAGGEGDLRVYWLDEKHQYAVADLDPVTGEPLADDHGQEHSADGAVRATLGGHHFVDFHYQLHAGAAGLWLVGISALAMLAALVSGVVTHRRIFKDFFTFRAGKGQRSWLDAHNAVAVLTLPFQFMIAYTGLALSGMTFMPAGIAAYFGTGGEGTRAYLAALNEPDKPKRLGRAMAVPDLEPFARRGQELMGQPVRAMVIDHPGDAAARVGVYGWNSDDDMRRRLSATSGMVMFSAATGEVLQVRQPGSVDGGGASLAQSVMGALHMVPFGGLALKWLYFLCGLAGSAMMATGAILFMVKRRERHLGRHWGEFGTATARVYRLIEGLNVAAIAGLGVACIAYLWANRLVPVSVAHRDDWELTAFFGLWSLTLAHALLRSPAAAWKEQLGLLSLLCLLLPLLNWLSVGDHLIAQLLRGDWESAGVELFCIAIGLSAAWACRFLDTEQHRAVRLPGTKGRV